MLILDSEISKIVEICKILSVYKFWIFIHFSKFKICKFISRDKANVIPTNARCKQLMRI